METMEPPDDMPRSASFYHSVKVEVQEVRLELLESLPYLDVERLGQADRVRIPVGEAVTDCCRRLVHAIVLNGMVTGLEVDQDEEDEPDPAERDPELLELANAARAALGREAPTRNLPIPLSELVAEPRAFIEWWTCFRICLFGYCLFCCYGDDPIGPWVRCSVENRRL